MFKWRRLLKKKKDSPSLEGIANHQKINTKLPDQNEHAQRCFNIVINFNFFKLSSSKKCKRKKIPGLCEQKKPFRFDAT